MSKPLLLDCPPRHPHAWLACLLVSQALAVAAWWTFGWQTGLPLLIATHLPFWWGTLWPQSRLFCPVLTRLPLMQVPLELPRSRTSTASPRAVSSACRREMVGS